MTWFERVLLTAALLGVIGGLAGSVVVLRRQVLFAQALSHATFPGAIVAAALGLPVALGAAVAGLVLVPLLLVLARVNRQGQHVASAVVLTGGFALGIFISALFPKRGINHEQFLFGGLLTTITQDFWFAVAALAVLLVLMLLSVRALSYSAFDRAGYRAVIGNPVWPDLAALAMTVIAIVALLPATGAILTVALLAGPAAAASLIARTVRGTVTLAVFLGVMSTVGGIWLSTQFDTAAGATASVLAGVIYLLALVYRRFRGYGGDAVLHAERVPQTSSSSS